MILADLTREHLGRRIRFRTVDRERTGHIALLDLNTPANWIGVGLTEDAHYVATGRATYYRPDTSCEIADVGQPQLLDQDTVTRRGEVYELA